MKLEKVEYKKDWSAPAKRHPHTVAREFVLQCLYMKELNKEGELNELYANYLNRNFYAKKLYEAVLQNQTTIDAMIKKLAANWEIKRIAAVERNILRLAIVELQVFPKHSFKIVINEAVDLAKKYSNNEAGGFINGVLDQLKPSPRTIQQIIP